MDGQEVLTDSGPILMDNAYAWTVSLQVVESLLGGAQAWTDSGRSLTTR